MRYQYTLNDGIDEIVEDHLSSRKFRLFIEALKTLNERYGYSIYLYGSYLDFIFYNESYREISFIITNKKILEISELTEFFREFHVMAKAYNVVYHMCYGVSLSDEDMNRDPTKLAIFTIPETRIISYYSQVTPDPCNLPTLTSVSNSTLYEGVMTAETVNSIMGRLMQSRKSFPVPIKIVS